MYAALALLSAVPRAALAQNSAVTVTVPAGQVPAGATVPVDCYAQGRVSGISTSFDVLSIAVTADAGSVSPATISGASIQTACVSPMSTTDPCKVLQGTANWTLPAAPGTYTVTCSAAIHPYGGFGTPPPDYV